MPSAGKCAVCVELGSEPLSPQTRAARLRPSRPLAPQKLIKGRDESVMSRCDPFLEDVTPFLVRCDPFLGEDVTPFLVCDPFLGVPHRHRTLSALRGAAAAPGGNLLPEIAQPAMTDCRDAASRFLSNGKTPLAAAAAATPRLTQKNACAIVAGKIVVSDSPGEKPETCAADFLQAGKLPPAPSVGAIQFP